MILQQIATNRIKRTGTDIEIATTVFTLGPIRVVVITNIPDEGDNATSYVQLHLVPNDIWQIYRDKKTVQSNAP